MDQAFVDMRHSSKGLVKGAQAWEFHFEIFLPKKPRQVKDLENSKKD